MNQSKTGSLVKLHLLTHVLLEAPLTKTNVLESYCGKRYCKLTMRELLIYSSKMNADLNFKQPK